MCAIATKRSSKRTTAAAWTDCRPDRRSTSTRKRAARQRQWIISGRGKLQRCPKRHFSGNSRFQRDGKLDLVVTNSLGHDAAVLLGNGTGTLQPATTNSTGNEPSLALGDLNGDGKLDLAIADVGTGNITTLLGNGHGEFQETVGYIGLLESYPSQWGTSTVTPNSISRSPTAAQVFPFSCRSSRCQGQMLQYRARR